MPSALIEIRRPTTPEEDGLLIDAVHDSLVAAFRIPEGDRQIRLRSYPPHRMVRGRGAQVSDHYTRVTIDCFAGRSTDAKRRLYREIVERMEQLGTSPSDVSILVRESALQNWGIRGGQAACDVDLGFDVTV